MCETFGGALKYMQLKVAYYNLGQLSAFADDLEGGQKWPPDIFLLWPLAFIWNNLEGWNSQNDFLMF